MIGDDSIYRLYRKIDLAKRTQEHRITNRESNKSDKITGYNNGYMPCR